MAVEFLTEIIRGRHSICRGHGKDDFGVVGFHDDPDDLHRDALELTEAGWDVWFGVHPVRDDLTSGRGTKNDVVDVQVLIADIDWADPDAHVDGALPDEATTRDKMRTFPVKPSIVVNSGHGFQAYWLIDKPIATARAGEMNKALIDGLKAHGLAAECGDVARVLRVPGTVNRKIPSDPKPVTVESFDPELRYFVEHLTKEISKLPKPKVRARSGRATGAAKVAAELDRVRKALRTEGRHPAMLEALGRLVAYERQSYDGAGAAIEELKKEFFAAKAVDHDDKTIQAEWDRAHEGAVAWCDEQDIAPRPDGFPTAWTDAEVGEAFADHIRGRYLWVKAWGWMRWDGRRWDNDHNEAVFEEARQWIIGLGIAAMKMPGDNGPTLKAIAGYKRKGAFDAIVTVARRQHGIVASPDEFDRHHDLLNVHNGVVDLVAGELHPHDPDLRLTQLAGAAFEPTAVHPDVEAVLDLVGPEVRDWLVRMFGYAATGHTDEDVVPVFDGAGANGKTTLLSGVRAALGDYASTASTRLIMRSAHDEHATLEADLFGRRLMAIEETPEGGALRVERIKALSGGGAIKARFIAKDQFEFEPTHTLVIATNHRPKVNSTEHAIWRRLRLVPFPYTLVDADKATPGDRVKDPKLRPRLHRREQREAMLAWIIAGAYWWHQDGLGSCPVIDRATEAWRLEEDVIARFLTDRLVPDPDGFIFGNDLFTAYREWCGDENRPAMSGKNFASTFLEHEWVKTIGLRKTSPQGRARYAGIRARVLGDPDEPWFAGGSASGGEGR